MINLAINGFGRIGRSILRALYEEGFNDRIRLVAINDIGKPEVHAHLARYDSVHGRFRGVVELEGDGNLAVNGDPVRLLAEPDPTRLPWRELGVDIVAECTGKFRRRDEAARHLDAGATRVLISAPGSGVDATVVYGVNHDRLEPDHTVVSNASCTTNCLAPLAMVLHESLGIERGSMTTIHAYTNDQHLLDVYHADLRRARAAPLSMIPAHTGAASAIGLVLPQLDGRLDGLAIRVPTADVSLVDLTFQAGCAATAGEVNVILAEAAASRRLHGVLAYTDEPLVSVDFVHRSASSIADATVTQASGRLVKVMAWYDNEWGFANRMLDMVCVLAEL